MADEDLRALERRWAEGAGELAAGDAFFRALERAGADTGRLLEVRLQVLRAHVSAAGVDASSLSPLPEVDPLAASLVVPGDGAVGAWHALRSRVSVTGAFPVLVGGPSERERVLELLNEVSGWDPRAVIGQADGFELPRPEAGAVEAREHLWPTYPVAPAELSVRSGRACLALLPTRVPWHAAAYLRLGADMDGGCPDPVEHVARHRAWFETHGAEPARLSPTSRQTDLWVVRPPRTRDDALALAAEQVVYCPALLQEAAGMLEYVAARLLGATVWAFEW